MSELRQRKGDKAAESLQDDGAARLQRALLAKKGVKAHIVRNTKNNNISKNRYISKHMICMYINIYIYIHMYITYYNVFLSYSTKESNPKRRVLRVWQMKQGRQHGLQTRASPRSLFLVRRSSAQLRRPEGFRVGV